MKNLEQGSIVKWVSKDNKEIVMMVTNDPDIGIVIHSDNLVSVGTIQKLSEYEDYELQPFVGTVHIVSKSN